MATATGHAFFWFFFLLLFFFLLSNFKLNFHLWSMLIALPHCFINNYKVFSFAGREWYNVWRSIAGGKEIAPGWSQTKWLLDLNLSEASGAIQRQNGYKSKSFNVDFSSLSHKNTSLQPKPKINYWDWNLWLFLSSITLIMFPIRYLVYQAHVIQFILLSNKWSKTHI